MPGLWFSGVLIYLGFANVYLVYVVVKLTVIMGAHCAVRWDEPLYRHKWLHPLAWVLERTFSTPATHWAHHALTNADGVGHYKGNFGNLLFVWDMLFGTAKITRKYPAQVGLPDDLKYGKERWFTEMFYPVLKSRRTNSVLAPGGATFAEEETDPNRDINVNSGLELADAAVNGPELAFVLLRRQQAAGHHITGFAGATLTRGYSHLVPHEGQRPVLLEAHALVIQRG
eukprot:gene29215-51173_t